MKKKIGIVLGISVLAVVAQADVLLTDNFNGSIDSAWSISYQGEADGENTTATAVGAESAFTLGANPTGTSLRMYDESALGEVNLRYTMPSGAIGDGQTMVVTFDFMSPNSNPATLANMQVQSGTSKASNTSFFQNKSGADSNEFLNHDGSSNATLLNSVKEDTWYRFVGAYSPNGTDDDSLVLTVTEFDGSTVLDMTTTIQNNKDSYNSLLFNWNVPATSSGSEFYIDNVMIESIPEPATLGMVAVFGAGILVIRRRFMM